MVITVAVKQCLVLCRLLLLDPLPPFGELLFIRCIITKTKVLQEALFPLNGICSGLLLSELQQPQDALQRHVAHWQQDQHLRINFSTCQ